MSSGCTTVLFDRHACSDDDRDKGDMDAGRLGVPGLRGVPT